MIKRWIIMGLVVMLLGSAAPGLAQDSEYGGLYIFANGEDFVREGFVSKDGWAITFHYVVITLSNIAAYQTDPPYDPHMGDEISIIAEAHIPLSYTIDLAEGDADADPIRVAGRADAVPGHYNALTWRMIQAPEEIGEGYAGYSLVIVGTAVQDDDELEFAIKIENEYEYMCGEYVGDTRRGFVEPGEYAGLEMTFHFDHIFGDGDQPPDDDLNELAPGFAPFVPLAEEGVIDVTLADLEDALSEDDYQMLIDILPTLGHVGEGHCYEVTTDTGRAVG